VTVDSPDFSSGTIENRTIMPSDIFRVIKKYVWLTAALSLSTAILAYLWARQQPNIYDATAMIELGQHGVLNLSSASGGVVSDDYELKITTLILTIQSRDVALNVIERLNLEKNSLFNPSTPKFTNLNDPYARNRLVKVFLGGLKVQRIPRSELVSVTYQSLSPVLSAEIANATVSAYLETNFQHRYQGSKEITGWLTTELDDLKARVQREQSDLLNLEAKLGLVSTGSQSETSLYERQLEELLTERIKAQTAKFETEAQYQQMVQDDTGASLPSSAPGSGALTNLQAQLSQLEAQKSSLTGRYGPGYPPLQQIESSEKTLRKAIVDQRQRMLDAARENLQATQKTLTDIQSQMDQIKGESKGMTPEAVRFYQLKTQYTTDQTLYNGLLSLLNAGGIESGLKTQEVNRMSTADFPTMPSSPRVFRIALAGFCAGGLLAIVIVVSIVAVSDTVETIEQIEEALGWPVLAAVPFYKLDLTDQSSNELHVVAQIAPRSPGAEAYRILRTSISLIPAKEACRVIGITSCGPGEGKSTTIINLGVVFSQQNKRVLLIDADLRKPNLSRWLNFKDAIPNTPGLSGYLSDRSTLPEECIRSIEGLPGLNILPVGQIPPFPSELLGGRRFDELILWARENFDILLIDTPPALLVTDALIIAQSLDVNLLVARVGVAQRRALRRVRHEFARLPERHVAVVVNAVPHSQTYYGGYGGYGSYYGPADAKL
jgi:succinoglycan biosynthesis transport protein ExoP